MTNPSILALALSVFVVAIAPLLASKATRSDVLADQEAVYRFELNELRLKYGDSHPDVVAMKKKIKTLQKHQLKTGGKLEALDNSELRELVLALGKHVVTLETRVQSLEDAHRSRIGD